MRWNDRCNQLIHVVIESLAKTDTQIAGAQGIFIIVHGEILPLENWVGHPQPVIHAIELELPLDPTLGITECLSRGKYLQVQTLHSYQAK